MVPPACDLLEAVLPQHNRSRITKVSIVITVALITLATTLGTSRPVESTHLIFLVRFTAAAAALIAARSNSRRGRRGRRRRRRRGPLAAVGRREVRVGLDKHSVAGDLDCCHHHCGLPSRFRPRELLINSMLLAVLIQSDVTAAHTQNTDTNGVLGTLAVFS